MKRHSCNFFYFNSHIYVDSYLKAYFKNMLEVYAIYLNKHKIFASKRRMGDGGSQMLIKLYFTAFL